MKPAAAGARDLGFALLIVLWSLVLTGLLMTQILASSRTAVKLAENTRDAAMLRADADGAINEALYHLLSPGADHWPPDGATHELGDGLTVHITGFADRINPNLASTGLLSGLLQAVGTGPGQAAQLATAIIQWRSPAASAQATAALQAAYRAAGLPYAPPGTPFTDLNALADVIGMSPVLLAKISPYLSLNQSADPDPARAGPVVRQALSLSGQTGANVHVYDGTNPTVSIEAQASIPNGLAARRTALVTLSAAGAPVPFQFLSLTNSP